MRVSALVIFSLMAFSRGTFSAFTKFSANEATSTPEPAPKEVMIFCALALLAAATCAAVLCVVVLTEEVAMGFYQGCVSGFDTRTQNLNDQLM